MAVARGGQADRIPVALIVDSPWLRINVGLRDRFPDVAWIPGFWVEYGMAAEPSAFGARVEPPDPQRHGLMPLVLQRYADAERRLLPEGVTVPMVASRGPFAVAAWLLGMSEFLVALKVDPEDSSSLLDLLTATIIAFSHAMDMAALHQRMPGIAAKTYVEANR